ncbi:uncharacterized protein [Spinacia oleracea]|uniref:NUC153 domain-containing protein n=1 Tax=Spinacia oleracea TaxID=3562 RepID=A0ABM3R9R8_SPIOL|nr:uncharacterized protein LOC110776727 [Spinacia oleracea]XP_056692348.1 uncharacterized protein LOC110776727 [Spinacia oleracea]
MSDNPYERVKGGRLSFKGGELASRSKAIDKKKKKKKSKHEEIQQQQQAGIILEEQQQPTTTLDTDSGEVVYTIDAARKMKYDDLFPVEAKKFGYDPVAAKSKSIEEALDDRVKKKADRYCK